MDLLLVLLQKSANKGFSNSAYLRSDKSFDDLRTNVNTVSADLENLTTASASFLTSADINTVVVSEPIFGTSAISNMISLSQATYDGITPDENTFYVIVE